jgi:phosphoglycerate dehydrogenase-like enzyme
MEAAVELGVTVCGTGGIRHSTAELTWGLILALMRHIPEEHAAVRAGTWQAHMGKGLRGKTLGLIGLGRLGGQVAEVGRAFGLELLAWSQNLGPERAAECGAALVTRDELLERADIVSIHLRLSPRTRGLLGAAELARMQPTAYLVNTSRGPIVDEAALVEALQSNAIAGAALDVFDHEPLHADHPFLSIDNVLLSPHKGYVTDEDYAVFYGDAVEDIAGFLAGNTPRVIAAPGL